MFDKPLKLPIIDGMKRAALDGLLLSYAIASSPQDCFSVISCARLPWTLSAATLNSLGYSLRYAFLSASLAITRILTAVSPLIIDKGTYRAPINYSEKDGNQCSIS